MAHAFVLIMAVMVFVNVLVYVCMHPILWFLRVPQEVMEGMRQYLVIIYAGLLASSLYNFFACLLRALGNSTVPLVFLAVSSVLNIGLDLLFVVGFHYFSLLFNIWYWKFHHTKLIPIENLSYASV